MAGSCWPGGSLLTPASGVNRNPWAITLAIGIAHRIMCAGPWMLLPRRNLRTDDRRKGKARMEPDNPQ